MDVSEAIHKRRSVTKYLQRPLEKEKLGMILDAGRMAPSSGNIQNWYFVVIQSPALKQRIAQASFEQFWMAQAPVLVVICANLDRARIMFGNKGESLYSIQNCACAAQNMMIMAAGSGIGSCFVSVFEEQEVGAMIGVPGHVVVQGIVALGYAAEKPDMPVRYELESICHMERFGRKFADLDDAMDELGGVVRSTVEKTLHSVENVNKTVEKESKGIFGTIKKHLEK